MDGFAALMTADFHDSDWTDQEIGYALARGIPVVPVRLERDPYGFLGKFQALASNWARAPEAIVVLLINNERMLRAYIGALRRCQNFDSGNALSRILPSIEAVSDKQIGEIIGAFNGNNDLIGSYGFNGSWPAKWGQGDYCLICTDGGVAGTGWPVCPHESYLSFDEMPTELLRRRQVSTYSLAKS